MSTLVRHEGFILTSEWRSQMFLAIGFARPIDKIEVGRIPHLVKTERMLRYTELNTRPTLIDVYAFQSKGSPTYDAVSG